VIDDLSKLRISFPFMEVVKISQQSEFFLRILDDFDTRMELAVTNTKQKLRYSSIKPIGKFPPFYITI
jgi:hypothetical protein